MRIENSSYPQCGYFLWKQGGWQITFLEFLWNPVFHVHVLSRYFIQLQNALAKWTSLSFPLRISVVSMPNPNYSCFHTSTLRARQERVLFAVERSDTICLQMQPSRKGIICDARDSNDHRQITLPLSRTSATLQYWRQGGMYKLSAKYVGEILVSLFP